ncbi:MAG: hypothetical protein ABIP06_08875 [Pyrinomonadaceae bacterium]
MKIVSEIEILVKSLIDSIKEIIEMPPKFVDIFEGNNFVVKIKSG